MLHFKSLTTEAFSPFRCSCELRSLWNDIGRQLALAQSAAKARRGRAAHLKRHQSPPKYGSISKFSAKYASTFLGSVLAFTPFIGYDSDVTSVELAIPQFISPQRAGTAAMAKSVYFKVRTSMYSPSSFGFIFIDLSSRFQFLGVIFARLLCTVIPACF